MEKEVVELEMRPAFIAGFPDNAIEMKIVAKVYEDGVVKTCCQKTNPSELADLIQDTIDSQYEVGPWRGLLVYLPISSLEAQIEAAVYENGEVVGFTKKLSLADIRSAFEFAENNYVRYVLTDKGKAAIQ